MDKPKTGFSQIPNQLIYDQNLSNEAKILFIYIKSLSANYRVLRNSNLCNKLNVSINTLQNAKSELVKQGYLVINRLSSANRYSLRLPKIRVTPYPKITQSDYPKIGYHYKDNTINNNTNINKGFKGFKKFKK